MNTYTIIDMMTGQKVFVVEAASIRGAILRFRKRMATQHNYPYVIAVRVG